MLQRFIWKLLIFELFYLFLIFQVRGQSNSSHLLSVIRLTGNLSRKPATISKLPTGGDYTNENATQSTGTMSYVEHQHISSQKGLVFPSYSYTYEKENSTTSLSSTALKEETTQILYPHHKSPLIYFYIIIGLIVILVVLSASVVLIIRFKQRKFNVANGNGHPTGVTDLGLRNISLTRRNIDSSSFSANRSDSDSLRGIELYELNGSVPDTLCRDDSRLFNLFYERDDTPLSSLDKVGKTTGENIHLCACSESYLYEVQNDFDIEDMGRGNRTCQMHRSNIDNNNDFAVSSFEARRNRSLYGRGNMTLSMDESLLINSYRKLSARYTNSCSPHLEMVKSESTNEICKVNIELKNEDVSSGGPILYVKESISTERLSRIYFQKRESSLFEEVMGELARRSIMMNMPGLAETNMTNSDIVHYSHQLVRDEAEHENNHKDT